MAINNNKLILSPPIQQNFIDENTRFPAIGEIYFYKAGTTVPKPVFRKTSDPNNPFVAADNPITLDSSGSLPYDIFFYPLDESDPTIRELYDIEVKDSDDNIVFRRENWPPEDKGETTGNIADDFIVNGQFNYPIAFYNAPRDTIGQISNTTTAVCFGWEYQTNANLLVTNRTVTFEEVINDKNNNLPKYLINIDSLEIDNSETINNLYQIMGPVEDLSGKTVTFAFSGRDDNGNGISIDLDLERNYGDPSSGASETETFKIGSFNLTSELSDFSQTFDIPSLYGKTIIGDTSLTLRFVIPLQTAVKISLTSVMCRIGSEESPEFLNLPSSILNSQIFGQGIDFQDRSASDNFSNISYFNGNFFFQSKTGTYEILDTDAANSKQNVIILTSDDQSIPALGKNKYGIPYINLYNVLGTKWGSEGDLQITSDKASLTFTSLISGHPHNKATSFSVGDTDWALEKVQDANKYGVKATKESSVALSLTSNDNNAKKLNFASPIRDSNSTYSYYVYNTDGNYNGNTGSPSKYILSTFSKEYQDVFADKVRGGPVPSILTPLGKEQITISDKQDATSALPWIVDLEFKSSSLNDYLTNVISQPGTGGFGLGDVTRTFNSKNISWGTDDNAAPSYCLGGMSFSNDPGGNFGITAPNKFLISFDIDGKSSTSGVHKDVIVKVPAKSTDTVETLIDNTVKAVNNPFVYKFTPGTFVASKWIGFGSTTKSYYVYFVVDGIGSDPTPGGGRDNAVAGGIALNSSDSVEVNLKKIANAIKLDNFTVPSVQKIFSIPSGSEDKISGVLYL